MIRNLVLAAATIAAAPAMAHDYLVVRRTAEVAGTPDAAWARIGDFCMISKLLDAKCEYASGTGDVGTVRRLNGTTLEPQVARTQYSYTYSQIEGGRKGMDYHGTLAVEPAGKGRTRIVYTLVIDQDLYAPGTDRATTKTGLETRFQGAVDKAKAIVEAK